MELAIGNFLTLTDYSGEDNNNVGHGLGTPPFYFQNFFVGESVSYESHTHTFIPFGFSGVQISRSGDNIESSLVFPNNDISKAWAAVAIERRWIAHVRLFVLDPDDKTEIPTSPLCNYYGQVAGGGWDESNLSLTLNSILDSVSSEIPHRKLNHNLVGQLPTSSGVRLQ